MTLCVGETLRKSLIKKLGTIGGTTERGWSMERDLLIVRFCYPHSDHSRVDQDTMSSL